jgi:hypothetical protein
MSTCGECRHREAGLGRCRVEPIRRLNPSGEWRAFRFVAPGDASCPRFEEDGVPCPSHIAVAARTEISHNIGQEETPCQKPSSEAENGV